MAKIGIYKQLMVLISVFAVHGDFGHSTVGLNE